MLLCYLENVTIAALNNYLTFLHSVYYLYK